MSDSTIVKTHRCYILIGLPGTGKTTWRRRVLGHWKGEATPAIISSDDYIEEESQRSGLSYGEVFAKMNHASLASYLLQKFDGYVYARRHVIVDRTNLTIASRRRFLDALPSHYQKIGIVFHLPEEILVERLSTRSREEGKQIPIDTLDAMRERYQPPSRGEFDRVTII